MFKNFTAPSTSEPKVTKKNNHSQNEISVGDKCFPQVSYTYDVNDSHILRDHSRSPKMNGGNEKRGFEPNFRHSIIPVAKWTRRRFPEPKTVGSSPIWDDSFFWPRTFVFSPISGQVAPLPTPETTTPVA